MPSSVILLAEDDIEMLRVTATILSRSGYRVAEARSKAECLRRLEEIRPDLALLDLFLNDGPALELIPRLKRAYHIPVFVLTGQGTIDLAVRCMQEGADQFLTKPVDPKTLLTLVDKALKKESNRRSSEAHLETRLRSSLNPFLGPGATIRRFAQEAQKFVDCELPVLIQGETGVGKGVLAGWLHENSTRRGEPIIDINCACLTKDLLESELFGHEKGAFTGASSFKSGLLEIAHKGVVFLDEVGDMDIAIQPKLLKFIEDGKFRRLGNPREIRSDVRLICASHQNLPALVEGKTFRSDLYFRISAATLEIPPLRRRREDIPTFVRHFLSRIRKTRITSGPEISSDALGILQSYDWPGNLRELRNVIERAAIIADGTGIRPEHLAIRPASAGLTSKPIPGKVLTLEQSEAAHIYSVLEMAGGSVEHAAQYLQIAKSTLYAKIRYYGIKDRLAEIPNSGNRA